MYTMSGIWIVGLVILIFCKLRDVNQKILHGINSSFKDLETYFCLKVEIDLQCVVEFGNNSEISRLWLYKLELVDGVHLWTEKKSFFINCCELFKWMCFIHKDFLPIRWPLWHSRLLSFPWFHLSKRSLAWEFYWRFWLGATRRLHVLWILFY